MKNAIRIKAPKIQTLVSVIPIVFFWANLVRMMNFSSAPYLLMLFISGIAGLMVTLLCFRKHGMLILFYGVYLLTLVMNMILIRNNDINSLLTNLCLLGMASLMLFRRWSYRAGLIGCYVSFMLVIFAFATRTQTRVFGSSNNYVSVIMLLASALYYIPVEEHYGRIRLADLIPAVISFIVSVWATGRGGILSAGVLLVLMSINYLRQLTGKRPKRIAAVCIVLAAALIIMLLTNNNPGRWFMSLGKWQSRGTYSDDRAAIWSAYLTRATGSLEYFLFGAPLSDIPIVHEIGDNCHNSFLQLHALNGIGMLILYVCLLVSAMIRFVRNRQYIIASIFFSLTVRALTDKFIFGQYGMPLMLLFIFMPYTKQSSTGRITEPADSEPGREER